MGMFIINGVRSTFSVYARTFDRYTARPTFRFPINYDFVVVLSFARILNDHSIRFI